MGPDHRRLCRDSPFWRPVLLIADTALDGHGSGRIPVRIITAATGGPFFLYLLRVRKAPEMTAPSTTSAAWG